MRSMLNRHPAMTRGTPWTKCRAPIPWHPLLQSWMICRCRGPCRAFAVLTKLATLLPRVCDHLEIVACFIVEYCRTELHTLYTCGARAISLSAILPSVSSQEHCSRHLARTPSLSPFLADLPFLRHLVPLLYHLSSPRQDHLYPLYPPQTASAPYSSASADHQSIAYPVEDYPAVYNTVSCSLGY